MLCHYNFDAENEEATCGDDLQKWMIFVAI
jgi:hypothetical protein